MAHILYYDCADVAVSIPRIEESARTKEDFEDEYLSYFYPFDKPDFRKNGVESGWSVTDREGIAITMAMGNAPQTVAMGLMSRLAACTVRAFPLSAVFPRLTG